MRTADIRQRWLDYFESKDHAIVPSTSLVSPDPSILFTIAGMVPFIPYILGTEPAPWPRAASVQKCIRTGDIENVGRTTRHGTFFQMNGNFSFGDYFKTGAIDMAWELLTTDQGQGGYGFDGDRLWVTLWDEDTESYDALTQGIGLDPKHIVRLPRQENFWDTGQPGPAGPCAEWHYDRGPAYGPDAVGGNVDPGGDRYLEIWNLVFDQFVRGEGTGKDYPLLGELERKAIDTGAGLERIAFLLQGKENMFEIDETYPVIERVEQLTGKKYGAEAEDDVRMRVIADHVRSGLMVIGDGVRPSNEGRGYVLRRILRRAVRSMRLLGYDAEALPELLPVSKDAMKASYPELETGFAKIAEVAYGEEEAFRRTLSAGTTILDVAVAKAKKSGVQTLGGAEAFALHDTYGFPIDLTLEMAAEQGVAVDEQAFRSLMAEQKQRARADALAKKTGHADLRAYESIVSALSAPVEFLGYTDLDSAVTVVGLLVDGVPAPVATAPADVEVVLDRTPFYAEAGGQLADQGTIVLDGGATVEVDDVQRPIKGLNVHRGRLVEGTITLGDPGTATIDVERRVAISRAHSATHMIHKALHELVGDDRTQAGSENAPSRVRFDFRSPSAVPASALGEIEERVNLRLQENLEVTDELMPIATARDLGAMALFGEKYGDIVRVVSIGGDWSRELCGGTHVRLSGEIGRVALLGEASIGSGVRRVDALVGEGAYGFQAKEHALVGQLTGLLGARPEELTDRVGSLLSKLKETEKELAALRKGQLLAAAGRLASEASDVDGVRVVTYDAGDVASADDLRALVLDVRGRLGDAAPVLVAVGGTAGGSPLVVVATNAGAREAGLRAGDFVKAAAGVLGGGGGGKPDLAQGGGRDAAALPAALDGVTAGVRAAVGA
ncbi:alanyl-tRNA synthetase [Xylanimonas cellulosilytica DSM 15894]|uniref:Alanine--tRNA ligase n=1 Tax=Xylanimonas cellulosilytica (strain DSM 15894 / JCM 12276 / CECT 5975 / KCTC 9989 / LMG 20990 / NBRC 107835 / XIL07) TaxID=446471 RepID=D1BSM0_XYLCX|nr:alanine--tRNA ligase [Xylanimonas cellulosilytica]ACZ30712.1 alanyl-tRNA synthetase [Xylanimonas cellulosilytica DSM 15894]